MADGEKFVLEECKGKIEYAKDNMERVPYEFYIEKYQQAAPVSISTRLGIAYNLAKQEFTLMFTRVCHLLRSQAKKVPPFCKVFLAFFIYL